MRLLLMLMMMMSVVGCSDSSSTQEMVVPISRTDYDRGVLVIEVSKPKSVSLRSWDANGIVSEGSFEAIAAQMKEADDATERLIAQLNKQHVAYIHTMPTYSLQSDGVTIVDPDRVLVGAELIIKY